MIQTETTPNPDSLKFLSEKTLSTIGTEEFKKEKEEEPEGPIASSVGTESPNASLIDWIGEKGRSQECLLQESNKRRVSVKLPTKVNPDWLRTRRISFKVAPEVITSSASQTRCGGLVNWTSKIFCTVFRRCSMSKVVAWLDPWLFLDNRVCLG